MKKFCFVCGLLGSFLILTTVQAAFTDTPSTHANYQAINYVQGQNIVQGYGDGSYKPDSTINRAELTKIIMATEHEARTIENCNRYQLGLNDVPAEAWFAPYVCMAKNQGVIQGYSDGTFKPGQNVTFVEAAKIISLGFGQNLPADKELWYRPYVNYLSAQSAIPDSVTAVAKNITRGEMAEIIYRLNAQVEDRPAQAFDEGVLVPMTPEIKAEQKAAYTAAVSTSGTNTNTSTTTQTSVSGETSTSASSSPGIPPQNPMICKDCPSGQVGQPANSCACQEAYIFEKEYTPEQCTTVEFTCGEGYEYFGAPGEACGCKLKAEIVEFWLYSDPSFKMNALEERPPVIHGEYLNLSAGNLEAALGNQNIVLFFHASWCPTCQTTDAEIKKRITELPVDAVIFKVDYDSETTLREKFEITQQHSMVLISKQNQLLFKQTGFDFDDIVSVLQKVENAEDLPPLEEN